ncbi:RabGAP/TBC domain-containing protein [Chloropicon primus]|uniref:RabGAP/TBC domain-containing protein n=1 Tax=Chloropicon primus TaxID=1764295 RepID=A0A5B8MEE0_9CHLO|nr:RabGAP/TBC domain-containing protein [Chloropicon primus]UPQ98196.1 RabGAP/TBC domain-containing protein [Chloropicon primus]|eukprot:QDZ18988.1 RabGAP/TBC domain-containing protein [Chloropicon primus]
MKERNDDATENYPPGGSESGDSDSDSDSASSSSPTLLSSMMTSFISDFLQTFSDHRGSRQKRGRGPSSPSAPPAPDGNIHHTSSLGSFELLDRYDCCMSAHEFRGFKNEEGRFHNVVELKQRIFEGGCRVEAREEIYPYLLGYLPFDCTAEEREEIRRLKRREYRELGSLAKREEPNRKELSVQIDKDIIRTDASHPFFRGKRSNRNVQKMRRILLAYGAHNFELGYCQGMSDLLAPLLYTVKDESECFWCFVGLMSKTERSFDQDQSGMHTMLLALSKLVKLLDPQLHTHFGKQDCRIPYLFCYRWLLLHFKREFDFSDCLRLWEALWTCPFCDKLQMYVCVAVLQQFRSEIIEKSMTFDDMVLFTNDLSYRIPLEESIRNAEILCKFAGKRGKRILSAVPPVLESK